ncbi:MAG: Gfo/Idh/MocA family oxidoreductase [Planctomycetes bacterium]|nr:Gfo/Idh/MocA family oxidoreductase [Planctomycetota bacterium]
MPQQKALNVALIGQGFMGRTHSNAWSQVRKFFNPPVEPFMHTVCGRDADKLKAFAENWRWANTTTNWKKLVKSDQIDLVDVTAPNNLHAPMALAAIRAGKSVACEKPIAATLAGAREMAAAAKKAKVKTFVWYNYRRCPAVALAHLLVRKGRIGKIRHVRAHYLQDWADEFVPLTWRFDRKQAGLGVAGDLAAHVIDMVRFVSGLEFVEISGAVMETFIKTRQIPSVTAAGGIAAGLKGSRKKGTVTVDDATLFLARFDTGAIGTFEAARQATGNQNRNAFEINGTKGALKFDFERMNELEYYDATVDRAVQGWSTIMCTHGGDHPYIDAWWPDAHIVGYEHGFVNQAYDILRVLAGKKPVVPLPDFADAYQSQRVLEAVAISAGQKRPVKLSRVK